MECIYYVTYTSIVLIHIFPREEMRQLEVTQQELELRKVGPLRPSHHHPPIALGSRIQTRNALWGFNGFQHHILPQIHNPGLVM